MIDYPNLIPECNIDTAFVEMLGYKNPNHASSITQVSSILFNKKNNQSAIGFVDNDKRKPKYFEEFKVLDRTAHAQLLKHPNRNHYLVVVNPAMDLFIFKIAQRLGIDLSNHGLPNNFEGFLTMTKKESIKTNHKFKNLLNTIKQKKDKEVITILSWIKKYSPYD